MGKEIKVIENELTFGTNARLVNVFSVFKYKKNNSIYIIYSDVGTNYNIIYYGASHVKNNSVLCMSPKPEDTEIIKEYIFKQTTKESLDNFEEIPLDDITGLEIINSARLEIKPEVLKTLTELLIPKKEESTTKEVKKKKGSSKALLLLIIIAAIAGGGYYYYINMPKEEAVTKTITCTKTSPSKELNATEEQNSVYYFNNEDTLETIETTTAYKFNDKTDYENFIYNGTMYKYMPTDDSQGGYKQDNDNNTFTIILKETVDDNYRKPTNYEEVLSYYKRYGYKCDEKLLGE